MKNASAGDIFEPEIPAVPADWDVIPFEKAAQVVSDRGKRVKQGSYLPSGKIPVIDQGQDYIGGYIDDDTVAFKDQLPVILFGDHTRSIKYVDQRFAVGAEGVKILRPADCYEPKFFYYLLQSLRIPSRGYSRHFQFLRRFHFPVAPKPQQKRIVAEIEKQFSRLDEAVANLKRVNANLKRYKATVLKAAVEGKLTEEWRKAHPDVEPASDLLKRILAERRAKWNGKGKYKEPEAPETTELPSLPKSWTWVRWEQIGFSQNGRAFPSKEYQLEGFKLLRPGNLHVSGKVVWNKENSRYLPESWAEEFPEFIVGPHELFMNLTAQSLKDEFLGRVCLTGPDERCLLNQRLARLAPVRLLPEFVLWVFKSHVFRRFVNDLNTGSLIQHMFTSQLADFLLPVAPLPEQKQIVAEVEQRLSVTQQIDEMLANNFVRSEGLRQAVLGMAFSGKLSNGSKHVV